jgi:hypothetical protein
MIDLAVNNAAGFISLGENLENLLNQSTKIVTEIESSAPL